jgi:hypothetical protein
MIAVRREVCARDDQFAHACGAGLMKVGETVGVLL